MATHSSVLAWRIPGTGEPGGLLSMGSHRVRHDWSDLAAAGAAVQEHHYFYSSISLIWSLSVCVFKKMLLFHINFLRIFLWVCSYQGLFFPLLFFKRYHSIISGFPCFHQSLLSDYCYSFENDLIFLSFIYLKFYVFCFSPVLLWCVCISVCVCSFV